MEEKLGKNDANKIEQKVQKKSEKDKNGIIGGLVFGILLAFLAYQIYEKIFDFPIGQMLVYIIGFLAFICFMVSVSSLEHCILYMAEECMKRKKALLHLYRSSKKDYFLGYLNKVGNHVICTYIENRTGNMSLIENKAECLIRYYKCILIGIILDWVENDSSYDLIEFCQESCELFSGSGEKALLKCIIPQDKC